MMCRFKRHISQYATDLGGDKLSLTLIAQNLTKVIVRSKHFTS